MKILHKFSRYSNAEKLFIIYLLILAFFFLVTPLVTVVSLSTTDTTSYYLLSGSFIKTSAIIIVTLSILLGWNTSFRFKNIVTTIFGFKDTESLLNFGLLWVITTAVVSIGETVGASSDVTSTIQLSSGYYFLNILLLIGIVFTFLLTLQQAKMLRKNTIVNINDDDHHHSIKQEQIGGLFGAGGTDDDDDENQSTEVL